MVAVASLTSRVERNNQRHTSRFDCYSSTTHLQPLLYSSLRRPITAAERVPHLSPLADTLKSSELTLTSIRRRVIIAQDVCLSYSQQLSRINPLSHTAPVQCDIMSIEERFNYLLLRKLALYIRLRVSFLTCIEALKSCQGLFAIRQRIPWSRLRCHRTLLSSYSRHYPPRSLGGESPKS